MSLKGDREAKKLQEAEIYSYLLEQGKKLSGAAHASRNRMAATAAARETLFLSQFESIASRVFKNKIAYIPYKDRSKKKKQPSERILNIMLSDLHYGSSLDPREVGVKYSHVEEARRTAHVVREVIDYKRDHRKETELYVHLIGDIIQGQLHDARDGLPLAEQCNATIGILLQSFRTFASEFKKVTVYCNPGNHGRNQSRHANRAVNQKWDAIETIIYSALRAAMAHFPNVEIHIPYTPYYVYQAFDMYGFMTHGDSVIKPGYPGTSINIKSVKDQINTLNADRGHKELPQFTLVGVGHVHTASITHLPGGSIFMSNGCLIPPDAFANSIGIFGESCGQQMWESVPGHILGDSRTILIDNSVDTDTSLDRIIKPIPGLQMNPVTGKHSLL